MSVSNEAADDPLKHLRRLVRRNTYLLGGIFVASQLPMWVLLFVVTPRDYVGSFRLGAWLGVGVVNVVALGASIYWTRAVRPMLLVNVAHLFHATIVGFACLYYSMGTSANFNSPLSRVDAFYLSIATFSTTGFGDIVATSQAARVAASAEMLLAFASIALAVGVVINAVTTRDELYT